MKPLSDFLPYVLPYVNDCPDIFAQSAVRAAAIELCQKSDCLVQDLEPVYSAAEVGVYELPVPEQTQIARVLRVAHRGDVLWPTTLLALARTRGFWEEDVGTPAQYTHVEPGRLRIVPMPTASAIGVMNVTVALMPTMGSVEVDDFLFDRYAEPICYGARARLYGTPNQPFFDAGAAASFARQFATAISVIRAERLRGNTGAPLKAMPLRWGWL